jgi:hypothetical protein
MIFNSAVGSSVGATEVDHNLPATDLGSQHVVTLDLESGSYRSPTDPRSTVMDAIGKV